MLKKNDVKFLFKNDISTYFFCKFGLLLYSTPFSDMSGQQLKLTQMKRSILFLCGHLLQFDTFFILFLMYKNISALLFSISPLCVITKILSSRVEKKWAKKIVYLVEIYMH